MSLVPASRWPTTLGRETVEEVLRTPLDRAVRAVTPPPDTVLRASIVIVTVNGLLFTRLCLESLLAATASADLEVIVVDNGSTDGTVAYLQALSALDRRVRLHLLDYNAGFAAATNRGTALARGAMIVWLNNDTIVPPGSIDALMAHAADAHVGVAGAVTNRAGNEAEIDVPYRTYGELHHFAPEHRARHAGERFAIRTVTMFCAVLRRDVYETIGPLDERFEIGLFEDDDYSMRVRQAGLQVVCARDAFVHHFGQASIGQLGPTGQYGPLFHANRQRWEAKWGIDWQPHDRRDKIGYRDLVERIRRFVCDKAPRNSTVLVISKGDPEFLELGGRRGWHFPQDEDGMYAGHNPADAAACIAELERLRARGADYLVIPSTARWWLEHYVGLHEYLEPRCHATLPDGCEMFFLGAIAAGPVE